MLPELKELEERGIFSQPEARAILKQRTAFESALIRRVALKSDYIKYVQYEITLEALRKKRAARLNNTDNKSSLADYCIVRRQFFILERAVRKFKNDVSLWVQYIELARSNNARSLVGKLCSRALSLHPTSPSLYIIAASHELDSSLSPTGARALLQRGLRINPESIELWTEYIRMELGYCEGLRRRWKTLGIDPKTQNEEGQAIDAIISGAIVKAAISSATESLPTLALLGSLQALLLTYPTELRTKLIEHLHSEFATQNTGSGPSGEDFRCGAVFLRAIVDIPARSLEDGAQLPTVLPLRPLVAAAFPKKATPFCQEEQTGEFVKRMQKASEVLSSTGRTDLRVAELYARWVAAWVAVVTEDNLRSFDIFSPKHYSEANPKLWEEARDRAKEHPGEEDLLVKLWLWGVNHLPKDPASPLRAETWAIILRGTLSHRSLNLHSKLLVHRLYDSENQSSSDRITLAKKLISQYRPSVLFFDLAMEQEFQKISASPSQESGGRERPAKRSKRSGCEASADSTTQADIACLTALYTAWRIIPEQSIPAALKYARVLYQLGEEKCAEDSIAAVGGSKGGLRQEWDKVRNELECLVIGAGKMEGTEQPDKDIALDDVEFN
ncbi:U3 small nucleolar RNA-associated protein 6 [Rhizoctonia solani]|uniref:U3 small nucleolar RNA-associated protein 6 n=1 Tax=Rhizoctonia solani TaxID=456999 RepID=A0A8H8T235_9AGAM|nr:U3 small nucleolar RNA-associated protein 6 [Rhizoctonia solani]QRW25123.1 U3 small nucleolar RNA-associated protein 6 [Rhizoctonia solani]